MKNSILTAAALLISAFGFAQNTNVTNTSKTTVTTIKDSDGEKKLVKEQITQQAQDIRFKETEGDPLNKDVANTPTQVTTMTQITNPDGSTRMVDVDRSAVYTSTNGTKFKLDLDPMGYVVTSEKLKKPALLRMTSTNSYFYRSADRTSIGYFDIDGNFVLESYDAKSDKVSVEKFILSK